MAAAYPICCWVTLGVDVRRDKDSLVGMTNKRQEDYCLLKGLGNRFYVRHCFRLIIETVTKR